MILGIDLGTTNSLASAVIDGKMQFVEFDNSRLLPSVVAFNDRRKLLIGQKAKNQYYFNPDDSVKSIKRLMGTRTKTMLAGQEYLPEEISALILRHIKEAAEARFGTRIEQAVITVPAYFSDDQRKATSVAGRIAGFDVKRIINEPTAAALSYNYDNKQAIKAVVYDLGGGTFDVSVVNITGNIVEVVSSHGNNRLGGDDFDLELANLLLEMIEDKHQLKLHGADRVFHQLLVLAERIKIELSDKPFYELIENIEIEPGHPPLNVNLEISREQLEEIISPYIEETMSLVHVALSDAGLTTREIDQILLVGGSSKLPLVESEFEKIFEIAPTGSIDPDQSVCIGAAVQGAIIEEKSVDAILVDITPYTFGTKAVEADFMGMIRNHDLFVPLIKRNTPLPVSKSKLFQKMHPEQESIEVNIHQGDSPVASENKLIGRFMIRDLSQKDDSREIVLSMNLDLNGILTVVATEKKTGLNKRITIDNSFEHEDISASVEKMSDFFNDAAEAIQGPPAEPEFEQAEPSEVRFEQRFFVAQTMIEKAHFSMDKADPRDAEAMSQIIEQLQQAIDKQNPDETERLTDELTDILFYID